MADSLHEVFECLILVHVALVVRTIDFYLADVSLDDVWIVAVAFDKEQFEAIAFADNIMNQLTAILCRVCSVVDGNLPLVIFQPI